MCAIAQSNPGLFAIAKMNFFRTQNLYFSCTFSDINTPLPKIRMGQPKFLGVE